MALVWCSAPDLMGRTQGQRTWGQGRGVMCNASLLAEAGSPSVLSLCKPWLAWLEQSNLQPSKPGIGPATVGTCYSAAMQAWVQRATPWVNQLFQDTACCSLSKCCRVSRCARCPVDGGCAQMAKGVDVSCCVCCWQVAHGKPAAASVEPGWLALRWPGSDNPKPAPDDLIQRQRDENQG